MAVTTIANATVRINDETIPIVPNSLMVNMSRGEVNVRAASSGGRSIQSVHSENVENAIGRVTFDVYVDKEMAQKIDQWKDNTGSNSVKIISSNRNNPFTMSMSFASLINDVELNLTSDGVTSLEFTGDPIVRG